MRTPVRAHVHACGYAHAHLCMYMPLCPYAHVPMQVPMHPMHVCVCVQDSLPLPLKSAYLAIFDGAYLEAESGVQAMVQSEDTREELLLVMARVRGGVRVIGEDEGESDW